MNLLYISNTGGSTVSAEVLFDRADGSEAHILGAKSLSNGDYVQWSGAYIVLEPGDKITVSVSGDATPHLDAMCTVEEYFSSIRTY